jgi:hypothetical protein
MKAYYEHRKGMYLRWLFAVFAGKLKASASEIAMTIHRLGTVKRALGER